ncbi:MAG: hypothetical protein LBI86_00590 [Treponema sp.]|jgi:hypothetical protein|nr:hypothetical protein [Treponema sp.]
MKILSIKSISRKDMPIYYRRLYTGIVEVELLHGTVECRVDFSIETKPTGHREITVTLLGEVDYPLVPLARELKAFIGELDNSGGLPG